ncbi:MAG: SOS response-associated peptidase [Acidimicrobiales bacterium]
MCGRYTSTSTVSDLSAIFEVDEVDAEALPARYNVAPTLDVYVVRSARADGDGHTRRRLTTMRWGLVPSWAKDPSIGNRMINARAEGISAKPSYRAALARRRCIVPADSFYEWQHRTGPHGRRAGKLPYAVRRRDGAPMAFAGLWEVWRDREAPASETLRTCTIVTTSANDLMAPIHDRMPVVLDRAGWATWLDPAVGAGDAAGLLVPAPDGWLEAHPVSTLVNDVRHDGPELLEPLPSPPA